MSSKRWFQRPGPRIAMGLVALFVLAIVLVPVLVPAEKWQQLAFEQLKKQTGLVATATGAKVSLIPLGLQLDELAVSDPQGRPEYAGLDLSMKRVVVRANLGSILRGSVEVEEVRLVEPDLALNIPEPDPNADASSSDAPQLAGALALLSIENGRIHIVDAKGEEIILEGLNNRASVKAEGVRAHGDLSGSVESIVLKGEAYEGQKSLPQVTWQLQFDAATDGGDGTVQVASLSAGGVDGSGTLGWELDAEKKPILDVALDLNVTLREAFEAFVRPDMKAEDIPAPWKLDDFDVLDGSATAKLSLNGKLPEGEDPLAIADIMQLDGRIDGMRLRTVDREDLVKASAKFTLAGRTIQVRDLGIAGAVLDGSGGLDLPLDPEAGVAGSMNLRVNTEAARALAESWWPRLAEVAEEGTAGPQDWPGVSGYASIALNFDLPGGEFDPETAPANSVTWTLTSKRLGLLPPTLRDSLRVDTLKLTGNLVKADVETAHLTGPGLEANAKLTLDGWPELTRVRGEIVAGSLDLDALQAATIREEETAWNWSETLGVSAAWAAQEAGNAPPPENLDLDVQLRAASAVTKGYQLTDMSAHAILVGQKLDLQDVAASMGGGSIGGKVGVDWTSEPPQWSTDLAAKEIAAGSLLEPFAPLLAGALSTSLSSDIKLNGVLDPKPAAALAALSGLAAIASSSGSVVTEPVLGPKISQFLAGKKADWQQLDFSSLTADVSVSDGNVVFDRFLLSGDTEVRLSGFVSLEGECGYRLNVTLPTGVTPDLGALEPLADLLRDEAGRIAFGVDVTGPAAKPKVQIDFADLQDRATQKGKDALEDKIEDTLKDKAGDLLGRFGRKGKG